MNDSLLITKKHIYNPDKFIKSKEENTSLQKF